MTWHVYTDGSAITLDAVRENGKCRYPGGWAAVIEHGSEGFVLRGRETNTTNVRMELRAAIEGVKQIPDREERSVLHFDCMAILSAHDRWKRRILAGSQLADGDLWVELAEQFERVTPELALIPAAGHPVHRRAHAIAQAEAKAQRAGLPANATVLSRIEQKDRRQAAMLEQARADDLRRRLQIQAFGRGRIGEALEQAQTVRGLLHSRDCEPGRCVASCPVWLSFGLGGFAVPDQR